MPKITEYSAPEGIGLRPTETGINAVAAAARRVQGEYNEAAAAQQGTGERLGSAIKVAGDIGVKIVEHEQISRGAPALAGFINAKTKQWDEVAKNADPNDPTTAQKFLEGMEPELQKFKEGFITENSQQWAESHVDQFRQHMFVKTSADMSTLAGHAAVVNSKQTVNALSNTVRSDPSSLDFSLSTLQSATTALVSTSPNLSGTAAAGVRAELLQKGSEEIVKSAAMGHIEKTGEVPDWASDPKYAKYINGTELKQFAQAARYYERLGQSENRAARQQRDYEAKNEFNQKVNELEVSTAPKNVGDRPTLPDDYWDKIRELSKHPGAALEPGRLKTMVTNGEVISDRLNKPEPLGRVSHETTMGLLSRMRATDDTRLGTNDDIYKAYQEGKLNNADFNMLNREFESMRTPEGVALAKDRGQFSKTFAPLIDGDFKTQNLQHSLLGSQRMYEFEMDARRQEEVLRKSGKDPHLVYDPRSEYYFGRPENIAKYRVSLKDAQTYETQIKKGAVPSTGKPVELPAVPERKVGQVYPTARGPMKWTGTGWVSP